MRISGFDSILSITNFFFFGESSTHFSCSFTALVKEQDVSSFFSNLGKECTLQGEKQDCYDESNTSFLFTGIVKKITQFCNVTGSYITVNLVGLSILYDTEAEKAYNRRVFQNPEKNMVDIFSSMGLSEWKLNTESNDSWPEILVQDDETDWQFINKLAHKYNWKLYPSAESKVVIVGNSATTQNTLSSEDVSDISIETYCLQGKKYKTIYFSTNKYFQLGEKISYENEIYIVDKISIELKFTNFIKSYVIRQYPPENRVLKSDYVLQATVKNNEDSEKKGKVQVEFIQEHDTYLDVMKDKPMWIETATFFATKNTGISFLPENGDTVLVQIKDGKGLVISCVRMESFGERLDDFNKKYLFLSNDRFIEFNPTESIISNGKYTLKVTKEMVSLNWNEKIGLEMSDNGVRIKSHETEINLQDIVALKAGKSLEIDGTQKINLKASKININGNGGVSIN